MMKQVRNRKICAYFLGHNLKIQVMEDVRRNGFSLSFCIITVPFAMPRVTFILIGVKKNISSVILGDLHVCFQ